MIERNPEKKEHTMIRPGMRVLVMGLGKSGLSAVRFLKAKGASVMVSEVTPLAKLAPETVSVLEEQGVELETGGHTSEFFERAELVLASPGVPLTLRVLRETMQRGVRVTGELALAPDYLRTPVVAVTGTNGKSTVTSLVGQLLAACGKKVFVGGNIGTPLTDYLVSDQDADVAVLEVSSFQLDSAGGFRPRVGVLLNITPDHLDRYESYEAYARSKFLLFAHQGQGDVAILNGEDEEIARFASLSGKGRQLPFGANPGTGCGGWLEGQQAVVKLLDGALEQYDLRGTALMGLPNSLNALAAILAVRSLGGEQGLIQAGLARFTSLPHRITLVDRLDGVNFLDDSKATNIGAVKAALEAMESPVVLIAGGRDKGGDYRYLLEAVRRKVKAMVLIGEAADKMAACFEGVTRIERAVDMEQAVRKAYQLAKQGEAVLLSPACASFDMFKSYGHRGEVFCQAVQRLKEQQRNSGAAGGAGKADGAAI